MATPKLKLGNDKWATKQRSLLAFNDEGNNFKSIPFNVERLSGGSYVGRNGLIQYAATEEPRIDFTNYSKGGLLLEPQRTNGCLYSKTLSSWTVLNGGSIQTITDNDEVAPDGTTTASTLEFTSTGSSLIRHFSNTSYTSAKHSCSFWAKKVSGSGSVFFGLTDTETEFNPTDKWVRYEVNNITPTNFGLNLFLDFDFIGSTGDKIAVWGMQFEAGTYSTSTIPTAGSTATRVQEFIENNYTGLTSASGTIFIDLNTKGIDFNFAKIIALRNTATGDSIRFEPFQSGSAFKLGIFGLNGASVLPPFPNEATLPINNRTKIAFTFSGSNFKFSQDGNLVTGTYTGTPRQYNQIGGANITGGAMHNGIIQDFRIYDEVLTDAELQTLTTL